MNQLSLKKRVEVVQLLLEGMSIRSTSRVTNVSATTIMKLLVELGQACLRFHSKTVVQVRANRIEIDEQWSFIRMKEKRVKEPQFGIGDVWTWVGIDPETKLIVSWFVGRRDMQSAKFFLNDLWCRLRTRVQLTSDGFKSYVEAVADTFGGKVDFAQVVKQYSTESTNLDGKVDKRERYIGAKRITISGNPDKRFISTSMVERQNLTVRMQNRRFMRDTNAHSKKYDNHCYSLAIHFVWYNFVRLHSTLRITPAMKAGLTKRFMTMEELVNLK